MAEILECFKTAVSQGAKIVSLSALELAVIKKPLPVRLRGKTALKHLVASRAISLKRPWSFNVHFTCPKSLHQNVADYLSQLAHANDLRLDVARHGPVSLIHLESLPEFHEQIAEAHVFLQKVAKLHSLGDETLLVLSKVKNGDLKTIAAARLLKLDPKTVNSLIKTSGQLEKEHGVKIVK